MQFSKMKHFSLVSCQYNSQHNSSNILQKIVFDIKRIDVTYIILQYYTLLPYSISSMFIDQIIYVIQGFKLINFLRSLKLAGYAFVIDIYFLFRYLQLHFLSLSFPSREFFHIIHLLYFLITTMIFFKFIYLNCFQIQSFIQKRARLQSQLL